MADNQQDPPWPKKGFTPNMMDWIGDLFDYLKGQRVVDSPDVAFIDAPGGGKAAVTGFSGNPLRELCNVGGELKNVDFLIRGQPMDPDPAP